MHPIAPVVPSHKPAPPPRAARRCHMHAAHHLVYKCIPRILVCMCLIFLALALQPEVICKELQPQPLPKKKTRCAKKQTNARPRPQTHVWGLAYVRLPLSAPEPFNLPVAILRRSLSAWRALGRGAAESIALTITTFPPHGSLSVVDLRLSGHIIVVKMPVVDPHKARVSFPLQRLRKKHDMGGGYVCAWNLKKESHIRLMVCGVEPYMKKILMLDY